MVRSYPSSSLWVAKSLRLLVILVLLLLAVPFISHSAPATTDVTAQAVAAGWGHTCVLMRTGEVRCWGKNSSGEASVPADLSSVSQISAGFNHTCAISAGNLRCWGDNNFGQTDVPADLGPIRQVSAGTEVTCVLTIAGGVRCWGIPITRQIDVPTDLGPVRQIGTSVGVTGYGATCVVTDAGGVRCWGNVYEVEMLIPSDLGPVSQISVGDSHACTLDGAGSVRCWGAESSGQVTVPANLDPVSQVSAGGRHTCAITSANELHCWGDNDQGQSSVPTGLGAVSQVSAGFMHTCAVTSAGGVRCWGNNSYGQIGNGTLIPDPDTDVFTLSGRVTDKDGNGIPGVIVSDGTYSATTDANGTYILGSLTGGSYTFTPTKSGYSFNPPSRTVSVSADMSGQDFTATVQITPLVFVPGIMGSYIYDATDNNKELWPGICDSSHGKKLAERAADKVLVADIIRTYTGNETAPYTGWPFEDCRNRNEVTYSALIDRLKQAGYIEYPEVENTERVYTTPLARCEQARNADEKPTLFVFAYDWRQSNADSANELKKYIDCIHEIHGSQSQIDILTHSMGGLIARRYLLNNKQSHHVGRLITVAAPFLGTPRSITAILTGEYPDVAGQLGKAPIYAEELKDIAETAIGSHELLPSPGYFALAEDSSDCPFRQHTINLAIQRCVSSGSFRDWINAKVFISDPGTNNVSFHQPEQDDWRNDSALLTPVPMYYHIYGHAGSNNTLKGIKEEIVCFLPFGCIPTIPASIKDTGFVRGDKTVTVLSASRTYGDVSYNMPSAELIPVYGSAEQTGHSELVQSDLGLNKIIEVLESSREIIATHQQTPIANLPPVEAHYLRATNVLSLTVTDAQGVENPAQISFYLLSEGSYTVVLPRDEVFIATIVLKDSQPALLDFRTGTDDTTNHAIRYQDLLIDGNRQAQVVIGSQGFAPLQRDANSDGTFDTIVPPTADVTGTDANDNEAPVISIQSEHHEDTMEVNIAASDTTGVKGLWYSLDRITFVEYTEPLDLDPSTTPAVYVLAEDTLANRSGLLIYALKRVYLPLVQR